MAAKPRRKQKLRVSDDIVGLIRKSHPQIKRKIRAALDCILDNPDSGKSLRDELKGLRSFKVGRIRIIYRISSDHDIEIVTIGPRKTIYQETYRLIKTGKVY